MNIVQWTSLFTFVFAWWVDTFRFFGLRYNYRNYYAMRTWLMPKAPEWVFLLVQNIVYPLAAVATHQYLNWTTPDRSIYDAAMALFLTSLILEKLWGPLFFAMSWLWGSLVAGTCLACAAIAGDVIVWVDTRRNGVSNYVAAALYLPFVLWVIYKFLLNIDCAWNNAHVHFYYHEDVTPGRGAQRRNVAMAKGVFTQPRHPGDIASPGNTPGSSTTVIITPSKARVPNTLYPRMGR